MAELRRYPTVHIVGVGGSGMSGLAKLLSQLGHTVTGSDLRRSRVFDDLADSGVEAWQGHRPEAVHGVDLVVASSAVPDRDPELQEAHRLDVPVWPRPQLLEALTDMIPAIGITGTHGKTTSSALAVTALREIGVDPSFIVGGQMVELNTGAHLGDRGVFVLEADEAFGTFERLNMRSLLVTNIEPDHLDHYGTIDRLEATFRTVAEKVTGPLVVCADDPGTRRLGDAVDAITYGTDPEADWVIDRLEHGNWEVRFRLQPGAANSKDGPTEAIEVTVPRPGEHVARNAAGVLVLLDALGYPMVSTAPGLAAFGGVRRRYEVRARIGGVTVVDDYAHHPTEIATTIEAARFGSWNRVWVVFQPHRYSRTEEFATEFGPALSGADRLVVTDVYAAGEAPRPGVTGRLVADAASAAGAAVDYVPHLGDVPAHLDGRLENGDLVMLLGAGDVNALAEPIALRLGVT